MRLEMKSLSDLVWGFLQSKGIDTVFYVSGGGCIFLLDALGRNENMKPIAMHHEQSVSIAAEGYARETNKVAVCLLTSGPGGTNAITGALCSYLDSIPVIYISGNVNKNLTVNYNQETDDDFYLRQLGDQEFNISELVKTVTKFSHQLNEPFDIKYILQKAYHIATSGRPGPVWIDIPLDVQSHKFTDTAFDDLYEYVPTIEQYDTNINLVIDKLNNSEKPLFIVGNGVRLSNANTELLEYISNRNIPIVSAVNGNDIINDDYEYYCGRFGTHAQMCANNLIQESDLIIVLGSRLYVRQTGYNFNGFGKNAYIIHVDIDSSELNKPTINNVTNLKIKSDIKYFINDLLNNIDSINLVDNTWLGYCRDKYLNTDLVLNRHRDKETISIYNFIEKLSNNIPDDFDVITANGSANVVTMQVLKLHKKQRLITNTGGAPMGYGLPAAIGASFGDNKNILCIEGDGSIHLNIQELEVIKYHNLPLKIIIINNNGYLSIKISQETFFDGRLIGTNSKSGLSFPDYSKIITAYGLKYISINSKDNIDNKLNEFFSYPGAIVLEVFTDENEVHEPKVIATIGYDGKFIPGELQDIRWSK